MAETTENLKIKATEILATPRHEGLAKIVDHLFMPKETKEYKTARALYDYCVSKYPNGLTLMLLKIYRYSFDDVISLRSVILLSGTLTDLRRKLNFKISPDSLYEMKPLLISCLMMQNPRKSDTEYLAIIVSFFAENVMTPSNNRKWEELSDCLLSLANTNPIKAFNIFIDLPSLSGEFISRFLHKFLEEVYKVLLHPEKDKVEDWILALKAAVKLGIQLMDCETKFDMSEDILHNVLKSADEIVTMGMEKEFLQRGIQKLEKYLSKDAVFCECSSSKKCGFVAEFAYKIAGIGTITKEAAKKIYQMVTKMEKFVQNQDYKLSPPRVEKQELGVEADIDLYNKFSQCTALDILLYFSLSDNDNRSRETAIRRLYDLVCDQTSSGCEIEISEIRELQPVLIKCLGEKGMPENMYRILGQVVFHVALKTLHYDNDPWFDLWDYIASESKAEFTKAVYIFQCLTMRLDYKDIVVPAIDNLLQGIYNGLTPPKELLIDYSSWVLTFTGAYCAAIHLLESNSHAGYVQEIAQMMIDTVRELVERKMEVGLVRRAFRDLETIVERQWDWYMTCEYRFVKGLLWRLYAIKGMKWESKIVLWRINVNLERSIDENFKVLSETEFDWLNQQPKP